MVESRVTQMGGLLYAIISILFIFWLIGFLMHIGGGLIHILLVAALILFIFKLVTGRNAV
jgi:hypothetical protein